MPQAIDVTGRHYEHEAVAVGLLHLNITLRMQAGFSPSSKAAQATLASI